MMLRMVSLIPHSNLEVGRTVLISLQSVSRAYSPTRIPSSPGRGLLRVNTRQIALRRR